MTHAAAHIHGCKIRIRLARDEDLEEIETMDRRFIDNGAPTDDTVFHVAELIAPCPLGSGLTVREIVAYGGHRLPPDFPGTAFLSRSGVLPECRGHGLQKALLRARISYLKRRHPEVSHALTYTMVTNAASSNSLIACGFKLWRPETGDWWVGPEVNYWRKALR
jgi:ribosomal protein S18 acetylase RimI-like enzyme